MVVLVLLSNSVSEGTESVLGGGVGTVDMM